MPCRVLRGVGLYPRECGVLETTTMIIPIIVIITPHPPPPFMNLPPPIPNLLFDSTLPLVPPGYGDPPPFLTTLWVGAYSHPYLSRINLPLSPPLPCATPSVYLSLSLTLVAVATSGACRQITPWCILIFWWRWCYPPSPPPITSAPPSHPHRLFPLPLTNQRGGGARDKNDGQSRPRTTTKNYEKINDEKYDYDGGWWIRWLTHSL